MKTTPHPPLYCLRGLRKTHDLVLDLPAGEYVLGNSRRADLLVPTTGVSRRHARLAADAEGLEITDLDSTNGTHLDGRRIETERVGQERLRAGVEIRFGPAIFRLETVPGEDSELALVFPAPGDAADESPTPSRLAAEETTRALGALDVTRNVPANLRFPAGYRPGASPPMKELYTQIRRLVDGDLPVLLHGETGAGKELVAQILHNSSERRDRPFVAVNCAAIPAELLEAEMFGIGKGVATGVDARPGKFRQAEGGTLLLDEIGEMVPALQAKLLRALQEKEIHPVGGEPRRVDVRILSATNVDLTAYLESGRLRSDLYYRLAGFLLTVPSLRDCPEDLPGLIETFVRRFAEEKEIHVRGMTRAALETLTAYPWPGNVRELELEIRRLVYLSGDGGILDVENLSPRVRGRGLSSGDGASETLEERLAEIVHGFESLEATACLELFEAVLLREALDRTGGNKSAAARLLGVSRNGFDKKLKRLGIDTQSRPDETS